MISEKNNRFRSKEQISSDVASVLNAELTWGTQFAVLSEAIWVWSEFEGKFKGCVHWTPGAWKSRADRKLLTHEHVVPKSVIIEHLAQMRGRATGAEVKRVLDEFCIGVVVLRSEDRLLTSAKLRSAMPPEWSGKSPWARYEVIGLTVVKHPETEHESVVFPKRRGR